MPNCSCHRQPKEDTRVSAFMLERALEEINKRFPVVDRDHDIPYLAGYSLDGKTIYIDRHLPTTLDGVDVIQFLVLHEAIEKALLDQLQIHYQHAHQIALLAEREAVRVVGLKWSAYDSFMQKYIKEDGNEELKKVPADLDLKPYIDEHDDDLLKRMAKAVG